jgi:flagellar biosynthesis protein FlhF
MNMKRFAAPTTREAMALVRAAFGDDAVVLSTKPCPSGIEVLAMAPEGLAQVQQAAAPVVSTVRADATPREDVNTLAMSTLSFQDYVRERMLRRRQAELTGQPDPVVAAAPAPLPRPPSTPAERAQRAQAQMQTLGAKRVEPSFEPQTPAFEDEAPRTMGLSRTREAAAAALLQQAQSKQANPRTDARTAARERVRPASPPAAAEPPLRRSPPVLREALPAEVPSDFGAAASRQAREQQNISAELKAMKGLIEERFGALAFMEKLQRQPVQARLAQKLLDVGFSPLLARKLLDACPSTFAAGADELQWAQAVLARNLQVAEVPLEARQGAFALIGSTGVGKTTSTAKIAAGFAARHGASQLGLITLDAYRLGAHEQLRAYGRILGVPVHTAHDRASLEDLLDLLANKQLVLIDTAGMAQRDSRAQDLLEMVGHHAIRKLLVLNASSQGETLDDGLQAWKAAECEGVILSKIDEAVRLAPALDCLIRHKLKIQGVANGQRVPEDWLRLSADQLLQHAFKAVEVSPAWQLDAQELQLRFATASH